LSTAGLRVRKKFPKYIDVEGDIFHKTLAIEENARFEGMSRRQENVIDTPLRVQTNRPQPQTVSIDGNRKGNGAPDGLNP
jgi:cytoskeletal protein CcmA (bactofilin family)